jgi:hypothetical protein
MIDFILISHHKVQFGFKDGTAVCKEFNSNSSFFEDEWKELVRGELNGDKPLNIYFHHFQSTLIPSNLFSQSVLEDTLNLNFGKLSSNSIAYFDQLHGLNLVNIYALPLWISEFKINFFPLVSFKHLGSQFLNRVRHRATNSLVLYLSGNGMLLTAWKDNLLHAYVQYELQGSLDVAYYTLLQLKDLSFDRSPKIQIYLNDANYAQGELETSFLLVEDLKLLPIQYINNQETLKTILCA